MAVVKPPIPKHPVVADIVRAPKEYAAPVVDTRTTNYNTLATFAAGHKWACDIYLDITGRDSQPAAFSEDTLPIYGQYRRVRGFELIVGTPITPQQGKTLGRSFDVTGIASCYSVVTPNEGSFFIADVGDGRNGIFTITSSELAAPFTEAMTVINYRQIALLSPTLEETINSRVVETLYFDRELLRAGLMPLIKEADLDIKRTLNKAYRRLSNLYLHEFFDTGLKTLIMPGQKWKTYDPHLTNFVLRTFDKSVCNALGNVLPLTTTHVKGARTLSVLDAIEALDEAILYSVSEKAAVSSIEVYRSRPFMRTIYYSGVQGVVSLIDNAYTDDTFDTDVRAQTPIVKAGVKRPTQWFLLPSIDTGIPEPTNTPPYIHRIVADTFYIFTKAFYRNEPGQSLLENITRKKLAGETYSLEDLAKIANYADKYDNLERYYYIPIILALIKTSSGIL